MSVALDQVLALVERAKRSGGGYMARCPAHEDRTPSLSIAEGEDGRVLLHCHGGCATDAILDALGLTKADLFEARNGSGRPEIVATYDCVNEVGELLFQVCRRSDKQFPQRRPNGDGGWMWGISGARRVLFRLPAVIQAVHSSARIWIVEGEKDVEALERAGVVATCNPGGAGKWRPEYAEVLRGADVVIVPDLDDVGYAHARAIATALEGVVASTEVRLPATGKDSSDHLVAGHGVGDFVRSSIDELDVAAPSAALRIVTLDDFVDVEEPGNRALVGVAGEALIPEGGAVMFYGDGGAGKTTLTVDLACHLAAGDGWLGVEVSVQARVLVVENEGPRALFRPKLRAKRDAWPGSPIGDRLVLLEEPWAQLTFAEPSHREALAEWIRRLKIDVVIVGPVTASGMEEAGTLQDVRAFAALLGAVRELSGRRVTFVLVHHENKGGKVSGAWEGCGDTLLHVQSEGHGRTRLYVQKARWASSLHRTTMHLVWTDGEGFAIVDAETRASQKEHEVATALEWIVASVTEQPGLARGKVEDAYAAATGSRGARARAREAITRELQALAEWPSGERGQTARPPALAKTHGETRHGTYLIPFSDADSPLAAALSGETGESAADPETEEGLAVSPPTRRGGETNGESTDGVASVSVGDEPDLSENAAREVAL